MSLADYLPGALFFFDCKSAADRQQLTKAQNASYGQLFPVGQEACLRHVWCVISDKRVMKDGLVVAVPTTSNPIHYSQWDQEVTVGQVNYNHLKHKGLKKVGFTAQCQRPRHFSADRFNGENPEIVLVGHVDEEIAYALAFLATKALGTPTPRPNRRKR